MLVRGREIVEIETRLPNGQRVVFPLARRELAADRAIASVIKDAGDDPDCTHGAEIVAEVELRSEPGVVIRAGRGVATVTKPGLGLPVGTPAVTPVPRRNIVEMVEEELGGTAFRGAVVTIHVPNGEKMAERTTNARLGLIGGISILGTTGIVRPYSTAAFKASVVQAIDVAAAAGCPEVVLTTGGKSERFAQDLFPGFPPEAFVSMGDFVGVALRQCARRGLRARLVGMIGKLSKMADGRMQTHAAGSEVNLALLASLAAEVGASPALVASIGEANTARHALELLSQAGLARRFAARLCRQVVERASAQTRAEISCWLVDFEGALLGRFPEEP
jgi:cobalt-precorrin-5B (C1)-methyltransferase